LRNELRAIGASTRLAASYARTTNGGARLNYISHILKPMDAAACPASVDMRGIAGGIGMLRQLLVGAAVSACNIGIHALVMTVVVWVAHRVSARDTSRQSLRLTAVMIATVSVLMVAHVSEVIVWSLAYAIVDAAPPGADLVYFAFVNYTTLGYGDVTPVERWRLLGPMAAMNGVLLFGWSTAVIFEVLRRAVRAGTAATGPSAKER
jgi:hypothetical protein